MLQGLLVLCVLSAPQGVCKAEKDFLLGTPSWATTDWKHFASHIVSGEIPPGCSECALVTACTIKHDVDREWNPWALRKRWYGWGPRTSLSDWAVQTSLEPLGCAGIPNCKYLGNENDYKYNWAYQPSVEFGNENGKSICVLWESDKKKSESMTTKPDLRLLRVIRKNALSAEERDMTYTK